DDKGGGKKRRKDRGERKKGEGRGGRGRMRAIIRLKDRWDKDHRKERRGKKEKGEEKRSDNNVRGSRL
ncbi:hypothetical protein, partial [Leucobacter japonicus]|uniref:hypothetical protein n=1 Tax=Leucobacter japonicus TaxID=1461259 RepID=UPI0019D32460